MWVEKIKKKLDKKYKRNSSQPAQKIKKINKPKKINSLTDLTTKFIELMKNSPDKIVNYEDIHKDLKIQKRRIYDIVNVLEGIGWI